MSADEFVPTAYRAPAPEPVEPHHRNAADEIFEKFVKDNPNALIEAKSGSAEFAPTAPVPAVDGLARLAEVKKRWEAAVEDEPSQDASENFADHEMDDFWWLIEQVEDVDAYVADRTAAAKAEALREAADEVAGSNIPEHFNSHDAQAAEQWLRERADRIGGAS